MAPDEFRNGFESVRVVNEPTAAKLANLSVKTWKRLRAAGQAPPHVRVSPGRIGYLIADLRAWLEERRVAS
jgi:predicted DNA-binding transcriptional regulator AlpA